MNKNFIYLLLFVMGACRQNSEKEHSDPAPKSTYIFTTIKEMPALPVTNQNSSGTCWSFSTISFLETEIIRIKGEKIKLSEMYCVRGAYLLKAQNYILRQGTARFTEGGLNHDPIISASFFGLMPEAAYTGLINGQKQHNHFKMYEVLADSVKTYAAPANRSGNNWKLAIPRLMDQYMGSVPDSFMYSGYRYTPKSFLSYTKLNPDNYVTITSFSHMPFYKPFVLSIPANWANQSYLNLPLEEFIENINHAIHTGYSLALDIDGTEPTFTAELGVIPENPADKEKILYTIRPEKQISQSMRQAAFENFETTDDHLVHIVGLAKDQEGHFYYKCKNSWGPEAGRKGYMFLSVPYIKMKGIAVLLHKSGLTDSTKARLSL